MRRLRAFLSAGRFARGAGVAAPTRRVTAPGGMGVVSRRSLLGLFGLAPLAVPAAVRAVGNSACVESAGDALPATDFAKLASLYPGKWLWPAVPPLFKDGEPIVFYGQDGSCFTETFLAGRVKTSDRWVRSALLHREKRGHRSLMPPSGLRPGTYSLEDLADALATRRNIALKAPREVQSLVICQVEAQPAEGWVQDGEPAVAAGFARDEAHLTLHTRFHDLSHTGEVADRILDVGGSDDLSDLGSVLPPHANFSTVVVIPSRDDAHA